MAGMNKAMIVGYVGQEPRLTTLNNGEGACRMSIATSESWTDKRTGEKVEKTEWHSVVLFGRLAEIVGQYVRTGDLIGIEGKLQTRKWTDNQGIERYTTEIVASGMNMLSSKSAEQKNTAATKSKSKTNNDVMTDEESAEAKQAQTANDFDSDIPF